MNGVALAQDIRERALQPGLRPKEAAEVAEHLMELFHQSHGASRSEQAYAAYQSVLHELHERADPETRAQRAWLASAVYPLEEVRIERHQAPDGPLEEFLQGLMEELAVKARLGGPMSAYLFEGAPALEDIRVYLEHHWYRSRTFYTAFAELAVRTPLLHVAPLYKNLAEESGGAETIPHPMMLQKLIEHLGLPARFEDRPAATPAQAYLNNRDRSVRTVRPEWGLAVLYALEAGTPATHERIYAMLRKAGIDDAYCEFHKLHMAADERHAAELLGVIRAVLTTQESRSLFLTSLRHHQAVSRYYFQYIWEQMTPMASQRRDA